MYSSVTAARPGEPFLGEAITSIYAQSLPPEKVIIVLNGDPKQTNIERAQLSDRFPSVEIVESPVPSLALALQLGLQRVQTRYVAFLDADDSWFPEKQAIQIDLLRSCEDLDAVVGRTLNRTVELSRGDVHETPVAGRLFGAVTFTREAFSIYGTPDPTAQHFTWLYRWWSRADKSGIRVEHHRDVVLHRRIHESNGWVRQNDEGRRQLLGEVRRIHGQREHA